MKHLIWSRIANITMMYVGASMAPHTKFIRQMPYIAFGIYWWGGLLVIHHISMANKLKYVRPNCTKAVGRLASRVDIYIASIIKNNIRELRPSSKVVYIAMVAGLDGRWVCPSGWGPRFMSHWKLSSQSCSRYQISRREYKAASYSILNRFLIHSGYQIRYFTQVDIELR